MALQAFTARAVPSAVVLVEARRTSGYWSPPTRSGLRGFGWLCLCERGDTCACLFGEGCCYALELGRSVLRMRSSVSAVIVRSATGILPFGASSSAARGMSRARAICGARVA